MSEYKESFWEKMKKPIITGATIGMMGLSAYGAFEAGELTQGEKFDASEINELQAQVVEMKSQLAAMREEIYVAETRPSSYQTTNSSSVRRFP